MSRPKPPPDGQLIFSILADLTPIGDGTFKLTPRPIASDLDTWITVAEAAKQMDMAPQTVRALVDSGDLRARNLRVRLTRISLKSIRDYVAKKSGDPGKKS